MKLFNVELTKFTTLGDYNIVHSMRIVACNKRYSYKVCPMKYWINRPYHAQKNSHLTVSNIILHILYMFQELWLYQYSIICTHMAFYRSMGCHTKRCIINAKVAPTDMILLLCGCIVCMLINIHVLFAIKGI